MIRRFLTRILIVILIMFCGYNWLEIRALRAEMTNLRLRQSVTERKIARPPDPQTALEELTRELDTLRTQAQSPETRKRLEEMQKQAEQLRQQADALWRRVRPATAPAAP